VKTFTGCFLASFLAFLGLCGVAVVASAQTGKTIRVVCYNIDADQSQNGAQYALPQPGLITPYNSTIPYTTGNLISGGVLEGIGEEIINGDPAQPIDILALEETTSNSQTIQPIVNGLNAFYAYYTNQPAGYAMSTYQATEEGGNTTSGNGPNALVYNTNTLQLIASVPVDPPSGTGSLGSSSGEYREVMRYEFAPAGVTPGTNNEFYVYVSHYKADSGSANEQARLGEATIIRSDEYLNLPPNARVLYVGDYNTDDGSGEPGYQTICSNTAPNGLRQGQGVDPLNIAWNPYTSAANNINWESSTTSTQILFMLSEEGYDLQTRLDLQVMTSNVYYDVAGGLQYVHGTYHSFGNNASLPYRSSVAASGNTALNDLDPTLTNLTGLSAAVLYQDLTTTTDHLPIVADYTFNTLPTVNPKTVFIILMENENWASISGNAAAPYINNTLLPMASYAEQYYNPPGNHPSLPNYLWLEAGTNFGITADEDPSVATQATTNHLVTLLNNAGISWTSYQEDISAGTCPLTATNQYVPEHNPMVYFSDVTNSNNLNSTNCVAHVRPFSELAGDIQSNAVAYYNFITPNLCDDMDGNTGCPAGNLITQGDTWLSNNIPIIMNSQAYSNNGVIFITWSQGQGSDGPIGMIVLSPMARGGGYSNSIYYTHSSTLLTMEELLNVGPPLGDAANATDLSDLFLFGAQLSVSPSSGFSSSGGLGGPFGPSSQTYTLSNTGGVEMVWSATSTFNWLTISPSNGTLAAQYFTNITVSINSAATSLASGTYSDMVVFATSNGSGTAQRPVSLTVYPASFTFGFFNDFSTFAPGPLAGQLGWAQVGLATNPLVLISGGQVGLPGGLTNNGQTVYQGFALTNETVFYGLTLTVTNAPNNSGVPYFATLYTGTNGTGTALYRLSAESPDPTQTNYVLGVRFGPTSTPTFGVTGLSYGTQYRVVVQAGRTSTNTLSAILYVNPTSGNLGAQTVYATNTFTTSGSVAVGSFVLSQSDSGTIASDGGMIGRVVVGDNFATVYTLLGGTTAPPTACFTANPTSGPAPLTVNFTDTSSNSPTSWTWTDNNGDLSTNEDPSFTYANPGVYTVQLIAADAGGSSTSTVANLISVYDPFAWWQLDYFGTNNNANTAPGGDYTGSGMSNTNKFLAGFNPTNSAAYLHIIRIASANGTNVVVTYLGASGNTNYPGGPSVRTNVLEYTTGAVNGSYVNSSWTQVPGQTNILGIGLAYDKSGGIGAGTQTNMTDVGGASATPSRYYRVRVLLP
jgi:PKD repeat protein